MNDKSNTPLEKIVKNFNESAVNVVDTLAAVPNAAARHVVDKLHGEGTSESVAGKFDDKPVSSFVANLRNRNHGKLER